MTTDIIGQLPCPECNSTTDLKTDGRKHTLKCHHCGLLAYYQTQQAKAHIEGRLKKNEAGALQKTNVVTLQLPEASNAQQRYILTLEQLAIEPVNGEMTTFEADLPANDQEPNSELTDMEDDKPKGFFESIAQYL